MFLQASCKLLKQRQDRQAQRRAGWKQLRQRPRVQWLGWSARLCYSRRNAMCLRRLWPHTMLKRPILQVWSLTSSHLDLHAFILLKCTPSTLWAITFSISVHVTHAYAVEIPPAQMSGGNVVLGHSSFACVGMQRKCFEEGYGLLILELVYSQALLDAPWGLSS